MGEQRSFDRRAPNPNVEDTADKINSAVRWLAVSTVVLFLGLIALGTYVYTIASSNNDGLCALRSEAKDRLEGTQKYLKEHPEGFPGITRAEIIKGLEGPKRTIRALKGLNCPKR